MYRLIIFSLCLFLSLTGIGLSGEEPSQYTHIFIAGSDFSFGGEDDPAPTPLYAYYYTRGVSAEGLFFRFLITTTTISATVGRRMKNFSFGIRPLLRHTIYSAYHSYEDGINDYSRCFNGSSIGPELFFEHGFPGSFKTLISYYPAYYFYRKREGGGSLFTGYEKTEIELPENHWEHSVSAELKFDDVRRRDINRIKSGAELTLLINYTRRSGYGTFHDTPEAEDSSVTDTLKRYLNIGLYYSFSNGVNILADLYAASHINTDRNNSEQIGGFVADRGVMPGYYWGEFYHNRYLISRLQFGMPLPFWGWRIQPGFNIIYMPRDNGVKGVGDYPERVYRSISVEQSILLGGRLPFFLNYSYGFDARRLDEDSGRIDKGNHEIQFYFLAAI